LQKNVYRLKSVQTFIITVIFSFLFAQQVNGAGSDRIKNAAAPAGRSRKAALSSGTASAFARIALRCVRKEYPAKLSHVINDRSEVKSPSQLHPAFNGCFDWHSCVHAHWMMTRLLRIFPELPEADSLRSVLDGNLTERNIEAEVRYLNQPGRRSFERMYGWAWLLKLSQELLEWDDPAAERWSRNLQPLTDNIVDRYLSFIPKQTYPIRRGVHANTAFGLAFALDYARAADLSELEEVIVARSIDYFADDRKCPGSWEPDGDDFLSPCLVEADLMRRVFKRDEFGEWFHGFLPALNKGYPENLLKPAEVSDRSDPKIVHLDGLNLSRAWCLYGIGKSLKFGDPARRIIFEAADLHSDDALSRVATGNYEGEHWLASFAVYMYSCAGGVNKR